MDEDTSRRILERILERAKPIYESAIEPTIKNTLDKFHDGEGWRANASHDYIERKN